MIVANPNSEDTPLEWSTFRTIEIMLNVALIDDKSKWNERLINLKYEHEGQTMIEDLRDFAPIMGFHVTPVIERDAMEATRLRVERDNFQETKWKKDY